MHVLSSEIDEMALPAALAQWGSILTIGSFDGVHVGHQALIQQIVARARRESRASGLVTFYPHPAAVLRPQHSILYLTTPGEKIALLEPFGLDWLAILSFTPRLAAMPPGAFVQRLCERANMHELWVGPDFALGRKREGDPAALRRLGQEMGFQVHDIPYVTQGGERVSSSQIRTLLRHGYVAQAARLLGRQYTVFGEVIRGARRGRCLGFPTANLDVRPDRVVPANGVYATYTYLGAERYPSVTNVGVRPSFDHGARSVEAHLIDFDRDLYGRDLVIAFVARLRPERRFADVQELVAQVGRDVEQARQILDSAPSQAPDAPPLESVARR